MQNEKMKIVAPSVSGETVNEAEVLGSVVWLWMHSKAHRNASLHMLSSLLLPAIKTGQFVLACQNETPVFYTAWGRLSAAAERRYLHNPPECMPVEDWQSGERTWIFDWLAPFGHTRAMTKLLAVQVFPDQCLRALYHHGERTGLRVMRFHGIAVTPEEARLWSGLNPIQLERA